MPLTGRGERPTFCTDMTASIHASCVEIDGVGVLLRGPSGAGKSDLALRLIDGGAQLVADDRVALTAVDGGLVASAPESLGGLLEVRGLGIKRYPAADAARIGLVIDLVDRDAVERLPDDALTAELEGVSLPLLRLHACESSAPAKVRLAVRRP